MTKGPLLYSDPWAKRNAWRRHPLFAKRQMFASLFPGFGIALVAFTTYVVADNLVFSQSKTIKEAEEKAKDDINWFGVKVGSDKSGPGAVGGGIGKYLNLNGNAKRPLNTIASPSPAPAAPEEPKKKRRIGFGDFEGW